MKQIDLDPKAYRHQASIPAVGWWFFGSLAVCIAALIAFWATSFDNLAMLAMFLGALNLGKSYARWSAGAEPVFSDGGLRRFWTWAAGIAISIVICAIVYLIMSPLEPFIRGVAQ